MSKKEKLKARLRTRPVDFTYRELTALMSGLGYQENQKGKTSGSRVVFHHPATGHSFFFHKPHPARVLKRYQVDYLIEELEKIEFYE